MVGFDPTAKQCCPGKQVLLQADVNEAEWFGRRPIAANEDDIRVMQLTDRPVIAAEGMNMKRGELLRRADELHRQWTNAVAEQVPTDSSPRRSKTDYNEHHHDVSATTSQRAAYESAVAALIREYQAGLGDGSEPGNG
jgi:hypothetical protein